MVSAVQLLWGGRERLKGGNISHLCLLAGGGANGGVDRLVQCIATALFNPTAMMHG